MSLVVNITFATLGCFAVMHKCLKQQLHLLQGKQSKSVIKYMQRLILKATILHIYLTSFFVHTPGENMLLINVWLTSLVLTPGPQTVKQQIIHLQSEHQLRFDLTLLINKAGGDNVVFYI